MNCKICNSATTVVSEQLILNKYKVKYHQCKSCKFIQTDNPFWLKEAYESAITALDIGLISRNQYLQKEIPILIDSFFPQANYMLDYGGGYGMFVRMMRDLGYNFYRQDNYCENLFANYFDLQDCPVKKVDLLTCFEVFEHLEHPIAEIEKMFQLSDTIIFSTVLIPSSIDEFEDWWYVSPLIGQHIAFYDLTTLEIIAKRFGKKLYSNENNLHILSSKLIDNRLVKKVFEPQKKSLFQKIKKSGLQKIHPVKSRESLLQKDYQFIEQQLNRKN